MLQHVIQTYFLRLCRVLLCHCFLLFFLHARERELAKSHEKPRAVRMVNLRCLSKGSNCHGGQRSMHATTVLVLYVAEGTYNLISSHPSKFRRDREKRPQRHTPGVPVIKFINMQALRLQQSTYCSSFEVAFSFSLSCRKHVVSREYASD